MKSSNAFAQNKNDISLNNLESKHSLLMKFGQFMSYSKRNNFSEKILQKIQPENCFQALLCLQRIKSTTFTGKWNFWSNLLILEMW